MDMKTDDMDYCSGCVDTMSINHFSNRSYTGFSHTINNKKHINSKLQELNKLKIRKENKLKNIQQLSRNKDAEILQLRQLSTSFNTMKIKNPS